MSDAAIQGVSGAIGGVVATIATYPLMTVTTRQATRVKEGAGPRQSTLAELAEIIRSSGWRSLFGGLGTALFGTTVSQGIYFYLYSLLRAAAVERRQAGAKPASAAAQSQDITVAQSLLVAALAGAGNVLLTNPIWMIATRMQAQRKAKAGAAGAGPCGASARGDQQQLEQQQQRQQEGAGGGGEVEVEDIDLPPPSFLGVVRSVYQEYGVAGFWNGVGASLVMVINPTIQYAFYEWLVKVRTRVRRRQHRQLNGGGAAGPPRATALEVFMLSALAKAGATVLTYPLLTIKTRMYTATRANKEMQYASVVDAAVQILRREGLSGYYKGLNSKIVQSVLAAALLFVCKEKITDFTRLALLAVAAGKQPTQAKAGH